MFKKSHLGAGGLAVIGVLFVGVMLLANLLLRGAKVDFTADKLYTISDGTERIVKGLKEPVNLYFFFSRGTATENPQYGNHGTRVRELLEELVSRSNGSLTLKVIDPQPYSEEEDRATELGITPMPLQNGNKLYLGLAATNSTDGKESIAFLDPRVEEQLEYDVAKLIHKLSSARKPVVGWLSSLPMQGDVDMQTGRPGQPWVIYGQVEQMYSVRNLEPTLTTIGNDVDVLVIVHPKGLPPAALYAIDQYALRGGHILAFIDPNAESDRSAADPSNPMAQFAAEKSSSLEPLLHAWGLEFKPDQVAVDLERGLVVTMRQGEPPVQHIAVLGFNNSSMAKDVITLGLDNVNMITAGSLKPVVDAKAAGAKLNVEPLISTSTQAGTLPVQRFAMMADPNSLRDGFKPSGQLIIAARVSGNTVSAFPDGPPAGVTAPPDALKASTKPLNIVVIADTDLLSDYVWVEQHNFFGQVVLQPRANNGELVLNAIDNLGGSNDLISIRGRAPYIRPFDRVDALRRNADAQFRSKEQQLQQQLQQTEETLSKLQTSQPGSGEAILSPEQAQAIDRFQEEKVRIRKELRATKAQLENDIESLGFRMMLYNLAIMPAAVTILGLLVALWRKRRRHAIAMLRKGGAA